MALILVIDDEVELLAVYRDILTKARHEVMTASRAREGLALYRARRPDLVIADIFLPDESGLNMIFELTRDRGVKVIAISGGNRKADVDFLEYARAMGAWSGLYKPVRRDELLAAIDEALGVERSHVGRLHGVSVLLVEDAKHVRDAVSLILRAEGATVATAGTAGDALALADRCEFDVLLIDLGLPDVPGDALIFQLRQAGHAERPFIAITAAEEPSLGRARRAGADLILPKPFSAEELLGVLVPVVRRQARAGRLASERRAG